MPCRGAGVLVHVCNEEPSKGFSLSLPCFKIRLLAQGRVNFMGTGLDEGSKDSHPQSG